MNIVVCTNERKGETEYFANLFVMGKVLNERHGGAPHYIKGQEQFRYRDGAFDYVYHISQQELVGATRLERSKETVRPPPKLVTKLTTLWYITKWDTKDQVTTQPFMTREAAEQFLISVGNPSFYRIIEVLQPEQHWE